MKLQTMAGHLNVLFSLSKFWRMTDFVIAIGSIIVEMPFNGSFQCDETANNGGSFECPISSVQILVIEEEEEVLVNDRFCKRVIYFGDWTKRHYK
jgi:hypothetical protein